MKKIKESLSIFWRNFSTVFFLLGFLANFYINGYSQEVFTGKRAAKIIPESNYIHFKLGASVPDFIKLRSDAEIFQDNFEVWIARVMNMSAVEKFIAFHSEKDKLGFTHIRYQLFVNLIPVEAAVLIGHYDAGGMLLSVNGLYRAISEPAMVPAIREADALSSILANINADEYMWENKSKENFIKIKSKNPEATYFPDGKLIYFPENGNFESGRYRLTFKFDIYALLPLKRTYVYVDALSGEILYELNCLHTADTTGTAITKYSGTQTIITDNFSGGFRLRESGRGGGIVTYNGLSVQDTITGEYGDFTDSDNYWNNVNPMQDEVATDAHWSAEKSYDYYYNNFGRNSYDNAGSIIYSIVHSGYPWVNAVWEGGSMSFGDGDSTNSPLTSIDIVGHELTHGVTEYSAGLVYEKEPGALNESFSDIFGTCIEFYAKPLTANFLFGEQTGAAFRSMENPNLYDCPDTYLGNFWNSNGDVHTNSGVPNYWFYLLSMGGSGTNDTGNTFNVTGIGLDKAAQIAYRTLTTYLTPSSRFIDARIFSSQAATDLFGDCSVEVAATENAWYAVGVGGVYFSTTISDFSADKIAPCSIYDTIRFLNFSSNANNFLWNFGDGITSNQKHPRHNYSSEGTYNVQLTATATGSCGSGIDSLFESNFITVTNTGPKLPGCIPSGFFSAGIGILNFSFNSINNSSGTYDIYMDYTCQHQTIVVAGNTYPVVINSDEWLAVNAGIWIDFDNNTLFEPSELVFFTDSQIQYHSGNITIPNTSIKNVPLRMRVAIDYDTVAACLKKNQAEYEFEDYSILIEPVSEVKEYSINEMAIVIPNPSDGKFSVYNGKFRIDGVIIYNNLGKIVFQQSGFQNSFMRINSNLPPGIYFLQMQSSEKIFVRKFVVK